MTAFHAHIGRSRTELEQSSLDTTNTSDAVAMITNVQGLKRNIKQWKNQVCLLSLYCCTVHDSKILRLFLEIKMQ